MMDTNTLNAILQALAASKTVEVVPVPVSSTVQIVTLILGAIAPVLSAVAIYLVRLATAKVEEVKKDVDGKMKELLDVSKRAAHAEGMTEQRTTNALVDAAHAKGVAERYEEKGKEAEAEVAVAKQNAETIAAEVEKVAKAIEETGKVV